ncbi:protein phosphatase 2C-like domain-containing protein 1 [Pseudophryne corroboree]|uniref:protein phosphatase 2C-like domain-containing protein 1 n=1 Tax=Pseudophryne corroboree TaxID=495146 RepID=UPI0030821BAE
MKKSFLPTIAETPNVDLQSEDDKDDLISHINDGWLICSTCHQRISPCSLFNHKQHHKANALLGYKPEDKLSNLHGLTVQREQMVSQIESSSDYKQRQLQKIDYSYETLKSELLSLSPYTSRMHMPHDGSCNVYNMAINNNLVKAIVIASDRNAIWKSDMEDAFTVLNNYGQRENTCFAGIFDGYHGKAAACTTALELPILFLDHISCVDPSYQLTEEEKLFINSLHTVFQEHYKRTDNIFSMEKRKTAKGADVEDVHIAYAKAFWNMDRMLKLGRRESSKTRWSGCSAVTCLIDGHTRTETCQKTGAILKSTDGEKKRLGILHLANIGNIKAVLCQNGKSYCLTKDHSTANCRERKRTMESGGSVAVNEGCSLVEGFSRITRGLGFHGDPKLKTSVIPAPYTISISIYHTCQFLILASSGLWEVLSTSEVAAMAQELLTSFLTCSYNAKPEDNSTQGNVQEMNTNNGNLTKYNTNTPGILWEEGTKLEMMDSLSDCDSSPKVPCDTQHDVNEMYSTAAAHVCQQIIQTAILAGSQQNITLCLILLPGCHT